MKLMLTGKDVKPNDEPACKFRRHIQLPHGAEGVFMLEDARLLVPITCDLQRVLPSADSADEKRKRDELKGGSCVQRGVRSILDFGCHDLFIRLGIESARE